MSIYLSFIILSKVLLRKKQKLTGFCPESSHQQLHHHLVVTDPLPRKSKTPSESNQVTFIYKAYLKNNRLLPHKTMGQMEDLLGL